MIDLHMHSKYSSDGIDEVVDMLNMAEGLGLKYISITDHNACRSI
ncbi:MAG: PHP domain-containing protein [Clostridia bacterium]|nr:PHP domain-containing protein [Clostridia bacterium]